MNVNWKSVLQTGVKFIVAFASGVSIFLGLTKLLGGGNNNEEGNQQSQENGSGCQLMTVEDSGKKFIDKMRMGQAAIASTIDVVGGVISVASSVNKLFDRNYYEQTLRLQQIPGYGFGGCGYNNIYMQPDPSVFTDPINSRLPYGQFAPDGTGNYIRRTGRFGNIWEIC